MPTMPTIPVMEDFSFKGLLKECGSICIPEIQRDYAQGRDNEKVCEIREGFINALIPVFAGGQENINLDFIYGYERNGAFEPLDGQQRLTTLFIIHWLFRPDNCEDLTENDQWHSKPRSRFRYATRKSSSEFCDALVVRSASELLRQWTDWNKKTEDSGQAEDKCQEKPFSDFIRTSEEWFKWTWRYDPTVEAMLKMMDTILEILDDNKIKFSAVKYENLDHIKFHKLNLDGRIFTQMGLEEREFKLGEDLYVKMNARGKELSDFDKLKSTLEDELQRQKAEGGIDGDVEKDWRNNIDGRWMTYFWQTRGEDGVVAVEDRFRRFLNRMIALQLDDALGDENLQEEDILKKRWHELKGLCQSTEDSDIDKVVERYVSTLHHARFFEGKDPHGHKFIRLDFKRIIADVNSILQWVDAEQKNAKDITQIACQELKWEPDDRGSMLPLAESFPHDRRLELSAILSFVRNVDVWQMNENQGVQKDFCDWMRFVRNCSLPRNLTQQIDKPYKEANARRAFSLWMELFKQRSLATQGYTMRDFIADALQYAHGIENASVEEEKLKVRLKKNDEEWECVLNAAESNRYLWGQLRAPLNWSKNPDGTHDIEKFKYYTDRLNQIFPMADALKDKFWKAMLCIEDYRFSGKRTLGIFDNDRDVSWKRFMRDEQDGVCAPVLKKFIDSWKDYPNETFSEFLDRFLMDRSGGITDWRKYVIGIDGLSTEYCRAQGFLVDDNKTGIQGHWWLFPKKQIGQARISYEVFITYLFHCPKPNDIKVSRFHSIEPNADQKNSILLEGNGDYRRIQVNGDGLYSYRTSQGEEKLSADNVINRLRNDGFIS